MSAVDILKSKLPDGYIPELGGGLVYEIISAMREYAKLKCEEQRKLCYENGTIHGCPQAEDQGIDEYSILKAPEPIFD